MTAFAQSRPDRCGTMQYHEYLKQTRKNYAADYIQYNQMIEQYMQSSQFANLRTNSNITIPVVIHVLYNTAAQNISDAQAISQFSVLNNDFQRLNADTVNTPAAFRSVAGGVGITFCLAQRDPNGNATTGIVHKSTTTTSFTTDNKIKASATGGDDPWDVTRYVNIWIGNISGGILGYGEFPTGAISQTYGLVLNYTCTGTLGTVTAPYNLGRTGTHEFGHCFNLNHIWGDNGQCGNTDNCPDTPPQKGGTASPAGCNYGSPTYPWQPNTCTRPDGVGGVNVTNTNGDMFLNYMDYTDDGAMNMFTKNQCARMLAVVTTAPWNVLASSNGCTPVSALDAGITSVISPVNGSSTCNNNVIPQITLNNSGSTTLTSATINYKMDATATQTLAWTGSLVAAASTNLTLNAYNGLSAAAHTFSVWVTSPNGGTDANTANNSASATFTVASAPVGAVLPFVERFDATTFPPTGWIKIATNTINAANTWTRVANTTGIPVVPTTTACAMMDNYSGTVSVVGQKDALRTPALSFVGANSSLNVTFDVSHKTYSTTDIDSLSMFISTDCGGTWTQLYTKGGAQLATAVGTQTTAFTPTANAQWRRETVNLSSYVGQSSVYLKFESRSGWGNNVYLDNVNVSYTTATSAPVASFTSSATKCVNSSITFTDQSNNTPTSWSWSFPGGTPTTSTAQNPSVTYTNSGTYTVTLTSANASGTSTAVSQTITVNASPTIAISNATICSGSSIVLSASGATTYSWNTGATTASISVTPTVSTNYTINGTNISGCANTKTVSVTVNSLPNVSATSATICSGSTGTIVASGASTYTWNTGATGPNLVVTPTLNTTYTVTGSSSSGCIKTATASIIVGTAPSIAVNSISVCAGSSATLTASGVTTYTWSTGSNTSSISVTPTATSVYTVTGNLAGCGATATNTATVSVIANPTVAVSNKTVCAGTTANLNASGAATYNWSTGATTSTISVSPLTSTNYTVTGTTTGCSNTKTVSVTIKATPTVNVASGAVCLGASANISASGATTYSWSTGATTPSITVTPSTTTSYSVTGTTAGCSNTAVSTVTVNTLPSITVNSSTICAGSTGTLAANGAATYSWNTGAVNSSIVDNPSVNTTYTVIGVSSSGCVNTATASITIGAAASISVNSSTICSGTTATLTASGVSTYTWDSGSNNATIFVNPTTTTIYTVTGDLVGCSTTVSQTATVIVNSSPSVTLSALGALCMNSGTVALSGSPLGGTYFGTGVSGSSFDPAISGAGTFILTYTYSDVNSCSASDSISVLVSLCTGINELTNSSIDVYPNPAKDALHIMMDAALVNKAIIEMYDATGKLVTSEKIVNSQTVINLNSFATGIYTLRVVSDGNQITKRIIKE